MSQSASGQSWRDPLLAYFTPEIAAVARLTIVADPDQLLMEQGVLDGIRHRGFELIPFDDHIAFRYAFESKYRQLWDRGEDTNLVVVLRAGRSDTNTLPYDLLEQARQNSRLLSFSIGELFPHLAPSVIADLDRADLDALYQAQTTHQPGPLGENATRDFILRHVFGVAPELIKAPPDLLRVLLRRHYRRRSYPLALDDRFIHLLQQTGTWQGWPLEQIVSDRMAFLGFLEERWPLFVRRQTVAPNRAAEPPKAYGLKFKGPDVLPFDHDDVRVYVDNLFIEGHLTPTRSIPKAAVNGTWMAVGVSGNAEMDARERFQKLLGRIEAELPGMDADHAAWIDTAFRWAEATALRWKLPPDVVNDVRSDIQEFHDRLEETFAAWMVEHYASLHNLSYLPKPVMVHHVPRYLAHTFVPSGSGASTQKRAVVVVDGLALDQWVLLREDLETNARLSIDEDAVFAWVPTLTSISRQSIFAGDPPFYFAASIDSTYKEESHWRRFWEDHGARKAEVAYVCQKKQEDDESFVHRVGQLAEHPKCRLLGVVVGTIDQTMHGSVMGSGGMHASVRYWTGIGQFRKLIELLQAQEFEVFITADHGNIECFGMGKPNVGAVADERGERVHVFRDDLTRAKVHDDYTETIVWPQIGIPNDYRPLLASRRRAFIPDGKRTVAHGGIAIEEVIVPFARIVERR